MTYPHLTKAPISEAVLDIQVVPAEWRERAFDSFCQKASLDFPSSNNIEQFQANLEMTVGGAAVTHSGGITGRICWNEDKSRAVQARLDGFSVNHVRSYENWDALIGHAKRWWAVYLEEAPADVRVTRCSVRFINKIPLPVGEDLSLSLRTRPEVSQRLPQVLEQFAQSLVVPFPNGVRALINQMTSIPSGDHSSRDLILDIDVSRAAEEVEPADIWPTFDQLRDAKNLCFFESLQESKWKEFQ